MMVCLILLSGGGTARAVALQWNTFSGGNGSESGRSVARDVAGNVYMVGSTTATFGIPVRPYSANSDVFVAKFSANGTRVWLTFLGGSAADFGEGIALDNAGNVYVTGSSGSTWGTPVLQYTAGTDGFVARLSAANGILTWNTFVGGGSDDSGDAISVGSGNTVFVTGSSRATWGNPMRPYTAQADVHVLALNPANGAPLWNTFLGGTNSDFGLGIGVDANGNVFVVGQDDGATWGMPVRPYTASSDVIVARLEPVTGGLVWNTFLGGTGIDSAQGITADGDGNLFVAGLGSANWGNPVAPFAQSMALSFDAFVARLDVATGALDWNTFMGSTTFDAIYSGIAADAHSGIHVAGESDASWGSPLNAHVAGRDAFVARLDAVNGVRSWNTFVGGGGTDAAYGLHSDALGNLLFSGTSSATWGSPVLAFGGGSNDAFVARLLGDLVFRDGFED